VQLVGTLPGIDASRSRLVSPLVMCSALMMGHHFSILAFCNERAPSSAARGSLNHCTQVLRERSRRESGNGARQKKRIAAPAFFRSAVSRRALQGAPGRELGFGLFNESHSPNVGCDLAVRRPFRRMRSSRKLKHRGMLADA